MRIEDQGLRIEEVLRMRIEDGTNITHFCRDFFGRKSRTFEDISEPSECPRVDILSFFPALHLCEDLKEIRISDITLEWTDIYEFHW